MFLLSLYQSPLWAEMDLKDRVLRIFILTVLLYILVHSYLYSKYGDNGVLAKFRGYIYYLIIADLLATLISYYFYSGPSGNIKKGKKRNDQIVRVVPPNQLPHQIPQPVAMRPRPLQKPENPPKSPEQGRRDIFIKTEKAPEPIQVEEDIEIPIYEPIAKKQQDVADVTSLPIYGAA